MSRGRSSTWAVKFAGTWLIALLCCLASSAQNASNAREDAATGATCGPPQYCARTDRRVEPYPEKPPVIGPAGSIITDPSFRSRILRVTDGKSDPRQVDRPLFTPSSAEQNSWNKDSTMFYVTTSGGSFLLYHFDPKAMSTQPINTPQLYWGAEPQFSFQHPNTLYGINKRTAVFEQYDASTGRVTEINDPSKCLKLGSSDHGSGITVSADDNRFMGAFGPKQDEYPFVYVYDKIQGCRWLNMETGEVGGQWGPKGTISSPDRFPLHNARMAKSGKFLYMTRGSGASPGHRWAVWEIDTLNVSICSRGCSGHHVLGYSHILGVSGLTHPMDLWSRPLNNLEKDTPLVTPLESGKELWFDSHFSWNNVDPDDSTPVCFSTYQATNPDAPGAAPLASGPWDNEIDCAETDGKASRIWRFAHTYSSARNGFWSTPRGNVSQDGRFFMFTSDWEDQLGKLPTGDKYRTDVFVVELK